MFQPIKDQQLTLHIPGLYPSQKLKADLWSIRQTLGVPADAPVPAGVGLLSWVLDKTESSDDPCLPAVLEEMPKVIWFAFGDDLGKMFPKFARTMQNVPIRLSFS